MSECYASRYLTDIFVENNYIEIKDSTKQNFYIDPSNEDVMSGYKIWRENIFERGISPVLTVFRYEKVEVDGEIHCIITKFLNTTDLMKRSKSV